MESDFLVIGTGIAGLSFALRASKIGTVVIVTKKNQIDTATNLAQGGIAAVLSEDDSPILHEKDTLDSGAGLCDEEVVRMVVDNGPERVRELMDIGVDFVTEKDNSNKLDLGKEGGHSKRRVAHAYDLTGREIERALLEKVTENPRISILENHTAIDLLMKRNISSKKCVGAYVLCEDNTVRSFRAKATVICSGGIGKVYLYTTNPDIATGDGVAMAFRAGAIMSNMEFVQFHPTCLYHSQAKNFLISEAVRGEGGILRDKKGIAFMAKYDSKKDLATRDKVARAIDKELKETGADSVFLDITHRDSDFVKSRFPTIYGKCKEYGIDITKQPIPVVPAAHYMCGGVKTDMWGKTSIDGLFALGETACTGLHGGNRLASNSLLEAVVYAERAYTYCVENFSKFIIESEDNVDEWKSGEAVNLEEEILINHNWDQIRRIMWNYVGIVRSKKRLGLAQRRIEEICEEIEAHYRDYLVSSNMIELRNIALVALMIIQAAQLREESRGLHYLLDFPEKNKKLNRETRFCRNEFGGKIWDIRPC